jgi:hypothetical protein
MKLGKFDNCWTLIIDTDEIDDFIHMVNSATSIHFTRDLKDEINRVA